MKKILNIAASILAVFGILLGVIIMCYLPYAIVNPEYMMRKHERLANLQQKIGEGVDACMNADLALHWSYQTDGSHSNRLKLIKDQYCMEINE